MELFFDITLSLITLTILEIVLGIDNLVFLAILSQKLPKHQQPRARKIGLALAWITRLLLLASAVWLTKLTTPLFTLFNQGFSGRDLFLMAGGLFLLAKSTQEIHIELEPPIEDDQTKPARKAHRFTLIVIQIAILDVVFSLDS